MGLIFQGGQGATNDLQPHVGGWRGVQMEREVKLGVELDMDLISDFRVAVGQCFGLGQRGGS